MGYPPLLVNETLMCMHGGKVDLSGATSTKHWKFENSNCVLKSELMAASIKGCPMPQPPNGPGPCSKIVMIPPTALANKLQIGDAKGDPPILTNVAGMMTDKGAPIQYVPAGKRTVNFGMNPATGQALKASVEAAEAYKEAEEMDKKEEEGEKVKTLSIRDVFWRNEKDEVITKAHVGDTVYLCARLKHCDESKVHIKIWEKDFDNPNNLVAEFKKVKLKKSKIYKKQKEFCHEWKVEYTADDNDRSSSKELKKLGYTLPEYYFIFTVKDNEGNEVKSHSSLVLEVGDQESLEIIGIHDEVAGLHLELLNPQKQGINQTGESNGEEITIPNLSFGEKTLCIRWSPGASPNVEQAMDGD